jgi:hypothetical protein
VRRANLANRDAWKTPELPRPRVVMAKILTCSECGAPEERWGTGDCPACGVGYMAPIGLPITKSPVVEFWSRADPPKDSIRAEAPSKPPLRPAPAKRIGRPSRDWDTIQRRVFKLMDHHGDFSPDDPSWNVRARLEEKIMEEFGIPHTQLRKNLPDMLAKWRLTKAGK